MKSGGLSFMFLLACLGCSHEHPGPAIVALTLITSSAYNTTYGYVDQWFFVSDKNGKVVDSKHGLISGNEVLLFNASQNLDTVSLTIVNKIQGSQFELFIKTYTSLPFGSTFGLSAADEGTYASPLEGGNTFGVSVSQCDLDPRYLYTVSNEYFWGFLTLSDQASQTYGARVPGDVDTTTLLLSGYTSAKVPVYFLAKQPVNGQQVTETFYSFKPFTKTFTFPSTETIAMTLFGHRTTENGPQGYLLSSCLFEANSGFTPTIGYFDNFLSYTMSVTKILSNGSQIVYNKQGALNTDPKFPEFVYSLVNSSFVGFDIQATDPYTYKKSSFYLIDAINDKYIFWDLYSPAGRRAKIVEIPKDLTEAYALIVPDSLTYGGTVFRNHIDGTTYEQFISDVINDNHPVTYEYYDYQ